MALFDPAELNDLRHERHRSGAGRIHPYFGKLDPALARALIRLLSRPGDLVLDPFCGSGTVLHEAMLEGRSAAGWDSSPLAILLAAAKTSGVNEEERRELDSLAQGVDRYSASAGLFREAVPVGNQVPAMPRVLGRESWFTAHSLAELAFLRQTLVDRPLSPAARLLADTAFSRIVVKASNQQGESSYRRVVKADEPGRVVQLFVDAVHAVIQSAKDFTSLLPAGLSAANRTVTVLSGGYLTRWPHEVSVLVNVRDTRQTVSAARPANLIVSSPPYLMSWDYGLYHKFRFYWLGFPLDDYEETEIGRHLRRKNDDVERYLVDMTACFHSFDTVVAEGGCIALVNAPSVVLGEQVDTNALLVRAADVAGWVLRQQVESLDIPGPHHGMYESLGPRGASAPGRPGKRENVLVFERS